VCVRRPCNSTLTLRGSGCVTSDLQRLHGGLAALLAAGDHDDVTLLGRGGVCGGGGLLHLPVGLAVLLHRRLGRGRGRRRWGGGGGGGAKSPCEL